MSIPSDESHPSPTWSCLGHSHNPQNHQDTGPILQMRKQRPVENEEVIQPVRVTAGLRWVSSCGSACSSPEVKRRASQIQAALWTCIRRRQDSQLRTPCLCVAHVPCLLPAGVLKADMFVVGLQEHRGTARQGDAVGEVIPRVRTRAWIISCAQL